MHDKYERPIGVGDHVAFQPSGVIDNKPLPRTVGRVTQVTDVPTCNVEVLFPRSYDANHGQSVSGFLHKVGDALKLHQAVAEWYDAQDLELVLLASGELPALMVGEIAADRAVTMDGRTLALPALGLPVPKSVVREGDNLVFDNGVQVPIAAFASNDKLCLVLAPVDQPPSDKGVVVHGNDVVFEDGKKVPLQEFAGNAAVVQPPPGAGPAAEPGDKPSETAAAAPAQAPTPG